MADRPLGHTGVTRATATRLSAVKRCRVEASVTGPDFGKRLGVGQIVDLDEVLGVVNKQPFTVRDAFPAEYFEELTDGVEA